MVAALAWSQQTEAPAEVSVDAGTAGAQVVVARPAPISIGATETERRAWLKKRLDGALAGRSSLRRARAGVLVVDVTTGEVLYEHRADEPFAMASNAKLVTAAAALSLLGPDFQYQTAVYADAIDPGGVVKGDLYIVARGDPSLDTEALDQLARDLRQAGITRVTGGVVIDDTYFDDVALPPHFDEQPDEEASFRAPVGALSLNFNAFNLVVRPGDTAGAAAAVITDPPTDYVRITSSVTTVSRGRTRLKIASTVEDDALALQITGQIHQDASVRRYRRRIPDPFQYAGTAFRAALRRHGIKVVRLDLRRGRVPVSAIQLAVRRSVPMAELIRGMGKFSNNFVAETVFKTVGAELTPDPLTPATWSAAQAAGARFLVEDLGLPAASFRYDNGSGLFDSNSFSPRAIVRVLRTAYRDFRYGPDLAASLSIAGVDGTLSNRMVGGPAARYVRAKTGTLDTVSALSGYAAVDGTRVLAFCVVHNDVPKARGTLRDARAVQDAVAEALVIYLRATR